VLNPKTVRTRTNRSCREQWIITENCGWTGSASASIGKSVEMVLKWRLVADCLKCMKQQPETLMDQPRTAWVQTHSRTAILLHYKFCRNFCGPLSHPLPGDILPALTLFVACVALTRWVWSTECQSCLKATLNWSSASTRSFRLDTRSRWTRQATVSVSTTMDRGCQQLPDQPSRLLRPQCTLYATSLYMTI